MRNSLSLRIIVSGALVVTLTLLITATLLVYQFRWHIEQHFDALLFDHVEELVAASKISPADGSFNLSWSPLDPRFHKPASGWYWEVRQSGKSLASSPSLQGKYLNISELQKNQVLTTLKKNRLLLSELKEGSILAVQKFIGPNKKLLRAQLLDITLPGSDQVISYVVTGPESEIEFDVNHFTKQVGVSFWILGCGLLLAIVFQVRVALKPLSAMRKAISEVQQGKKKRLPKNYPEEIQLVVSEINSLLDHRAETIIRARNNLGNLAHTIKNPLAVIINEANCINSEPGQLIQNKATLIATNLDHYLAQARAAGTRDLLGYRTDISKVVEGLCFCVEQLYKDKHIQINIDDLANYYFSGEVQDLEEMLGNLIDNACKWTQDQVWVHAKLGKNNKRILLFVEDNGPGIPDSQLNNVLQRGRRLDDSVSGHGLGLNIVNDITQLYSGSLTLKKSSYGGLCAVLDLPVAR